MKFCIDEKNKHSSGVYIIKGGSLPYVGQASNFWKRRRSHMNRLNSKTHSNPILLASWHKNGAEIFTFELLELCDRDKKILCEVEQKWIDHFGYENLANIDPVAGSRLGSKVDVGTRIKISKSLGGEGTPGGYFNPRYKRWEAWAYIDGKRTTLRYYDTREEALEARANYDLYGQIPEKESEVRRNNTSGYTGVYMRKDGSRQFWGVRLIRQKKEIFLGNFKTPEEANSHRLEFLDLLKQMETA